MGIKKIIPMLIVLLFIFSAKALYLQEDAESMDPGPVGNYVGQFKDLSEKHDEGKFNEIFKAPQDFKNIIVKNNKALEDDWTGGGKNSDKLDMGYAADLGKYLAKIIKDNLDNPERIKLVGGYIEKLNETLLKNDYKTAAWKVYDNISGEFKNILKKLTSTTGLTQPMENLNKELAPIGYDKRGEASNKLTALAKKLIGECSIFPLLNDIEKLKKQNDTLEGRIEKLEKGEAVTSAWGWLKKIIKTQVAWFIIGLMVILFIAITIFSFFVLYIRRQLQVEIPSLLDSKEPGENGPPAYSTSPSELIKGKVEHAADQIAPGPYKTKTKEHKKFWSINKGFSELAKEIAGLKKVEGSFLDVKSGGDDVDKDKLRPEMDYEGLSDKIKENIDKKFDRLKIESFERLINIFYKHVDLEVKELKSTMEKQETSLSGKFLKIMVGYEREILKEIWQWKPSDSERQQLFSLAREIDEKEEFFRQCIELRNQISFNKELSSYYETILQPMQNYEYNLSEFRDTPQMLKKDVSSNPIKDIFDIKQKVYFLIFLQHLNQVPELLKFSLEKWFKEEFLDFADQFLRRYQKDLFSGTLSEEMETANGKILDILSFFNIEPIHIVLGQTAFNSQVHMGQSNVCDSSMIDGAIAEVVKNGFRIKQGEILIKPEVFVNRL